MYEAVAQAQEPTKISRIGLLNTNAAAAFAARTEAFRQGLREFGYLEGKNIQVEYRYAEGKLDRLPALAAELVRLKVDVIVTAVSSATRSAKEATSTIPIVMAQDNDPVGNGLSAAWRDLAATLLGFQAFPRKSAENNWSFLKRSLQSSPAQP